MVTLLEPPAALRTSLASQPRLECKPLPTHSPSIPELRYNWHILTLARPYQQQEGTIVGHLSLKGALRGLKLLKRLAAGENTQEFQPLQQRHVFISRLLQHSLIKIKPAPAASSRG